MSYNMFWRFSKKNLKKAFIIQNTFNYTNIYNKF